MEPLCTLKDSSPSCPSKSYTAVVVGWAGVGAGGWVRVGAGRLTGAAAKR